MRCTCISVQQINSASNHAWTVAPSQQLRQTCPLCVLQRTLWSMGVLSNCSDSSSCPLVDLNNRQYTSLASSNPAVAQVMAAYPPPNASES